MIITNKTKDLLFKTDKSFFDSMINFTQSEVQTHIRNKYKINIEANYYPNIERYCVSYLPMFLDKPRDLLRKGLTMAEIIKVRKKYVSKERFLEYEDALEFGIIESLTLIKNDNNTLWNK